MVTFLIDHSTDPPTRRVGFMAQVCAIVEFFISVFAVFLFSFFHKRLSIGLYLANADIPCHWRWCGCTAAGLVVKNNFKSLSASLICNRAATSSGPSGITRFIPL